jgi:hypothetical protein
MTDRLDEELDDLIAKIKQQTKHRDPLRKWMAQRALDSARMAQGAIAQLRTRLQEFPVLAEDLAEPAQFLLPPGPPPAPMSTGAAAAAPIVDIEEAQPAAEPVRPTKPHVARVASTRTPLVAAEPGEACEMVGDGECDGALYSTTCDECGLLLVRCVGHEGLSLKRIMGGHRSRHTRSKRHGTPDVGPRLRRQTKTPSYVPATAATLPVAPTPSASPERRNLVADRMRARKEQETVPAPEVAPRNAKGRTAAAQELLEELGVADEPEDENDGRILFDDPEHNEPDEREPEPPENPKVGGQDAEILPPRNLTQTSERTVRVGRYRRPVGPAKRTLPLRLLRKANIDEAEADGDLPDPGQYDRPLVRGDCLPGGVNEARPCPFVSCRYHLLLSVNEETGTITFAHSLDSGVETLRRTCALDVADEGGVILDEIGRLMNLTRERVRQIEVKGLEAMKQATRGIVSREDVLSLGMEVGRQEDDPG